MKNTKQVCLNLTKPQFNRLKILSDNQGQTVTAIIRFAIDEFLRSRDNTSVKKGGIHGNNNPNRENLRQE